MGLHQEEDIIQPMERMTSSGDRHQVCSVQVQVEQLKEWLTIMEYGGAIKLEAYRPLWCQCNCEDVP